jgi:hypothetical protein
MKRSSRVLGLCYVVVKVALLLVIEILAFPVVARHLLTLALRRHAQGRGPFARTTKILAALHRANYVRINPVKLSCVVSRDKHGCQIFIDTIYPNRKIMPKYLNIT